MFQALAAVISLLMAVEIGYSLYEQFSERAVPIADFLSPLVLILTMVSLYYPLKAHHSPLVLILTMVSLYNTLKAHHSPLVLILTM